MKTIDDVIEQCEEIANASKQHTLHMTHFSQSYDEWAEEWTQIAELLKELKAYKDARAEIAKTFNDDVRNDQNDYERGRKSGIFLCESIISVKLGESSSEKPNKWISAEVLDKIRAEIDEQYDRVYPYDISCAEGLEMALGIIDKYKAEGSEK